MEIKIMKMDDGYELFVNSVLVKKGKVLAHIRKMANEIIFDSEETIRENKPMDKRTEVDELY